MEKGKGVGPLVGEYLPAPGVPEVQSFKAEDIYGFDEVVEALTKVEDVFRTVCVNPQENDTLRILPDIYNSDGSLNEAALDERNRRIHARRAREKIQSDVDDFIWRVGLPLLGALLIGIAVLTRFI